MKRQKVIVVILGFCLAVGIAGMGLIAWFFCYVFSDPKALDGVPQMAIMGAYLGVGESAMEARQYGFAEQMFRTALNIAQREKDNKTDCAEALTRIGQCLRRQNKAGEALKTFQKASKLYEEAEETEFVFSTDKRIKLKALMETAAILKDQGCQKEAEALSPEIGKLKEELGPVEEFRQKTTEL